MGLLGTAAKAYVATRVVGGTHRRQQQRWAAQGAQAAPESRLEQQGSAQPPASGVAPMLEQLTQLGQLRDAGVLTETEFETQKQRILASGESHR